MADQWFYTSDGQQVGPVSLLELRELASSGRLQPSDLVWKEGMFQWMPAGQTRGLFAPAAAEEATPPVPQPAAPADPAGEPVAAGAPGAPEPVTPRPRKSPPPPAGLSTGARVAIFGGITAAVLLVVAVVALAIVLNNREGD